MQNDERRPEDAAATPYRDASVPLGSVVRALDALRDGDAQFAEEILSAAVDGHPRHAPTRCRWCTFRGWPGEVEAHEIRNHARLLVDAA